MDWLKFAQRRSEGTRKSAAGNTVYDIGYTGIEDRYAFDFKLCKHTDGWKQFDTEQDASYFGVWVHLEQRLTVTYAEGDLTVVHCEDDEHLKAELISMAEFYGEPPPAFKTIDADGTLTLYYDKRPEVENGA